MRTLWVFCAVAVLFTFHCMSVPANRQHARFGGRASPAAQSPATAGRLAATDQNPGGRLSAADRAAPYAEIADDEAFVWPLPATVKPPQNPKLERISYVGNKNLSDDLLADVMEQTGVKIDSPCNPIANRQAATELESSYHLVGCFSAKVELEKGGSPEDREVSFKIDEGPKGVIAKIRFTGNTSVPSDVLRLILKTRAQWWPSTRYWLPAVDRFAIWTYYYHRGFFDVQVSHQNHFSPERTRVTVEYIIDEGVRAKVRIVFRGNRVVSDEQLLNALDVHEGDFFDLRQVEAVKEQVIARYRKAGRMSTNVKSTSQYFPGTHCANLFCDIDEGRGPPAAIEQVGAEIGLHRLAAFERKNTERQPGVYEQSEDIDELLERFANVDGLDAALREGGASSMAQPTEPPDVRDLDRLVFKGVETFDVADIRKSLSVDFDTILAGHPGGDLQRFLETLEKQIRAGYRHRGFPDVAVHAVANEQEQRIEIRVTEGECYRCGDVKFIDALPEEVPIRMLISDPNPSAAYWEKGEPVPFDDVTLTSMQEELTAQFAAAGFFRPDFEFSINRDPDTAMANLVVIFKQAGPQAVVGNVEITGTGRDSESGVLKFLDLRPGMPYDSDLPRRLKLRLWESGRYLSSDVSEGDVSENFRAGTQSHDLKIGLWEYEKAPPLAGELSPAEQAVLKLGEWLRHWSKGEVEEDVVVAAMIVPERFLEEPTQGNEQKPVAARPGETQFAFRMVMGPERGQTLALTATPGGGRPIVDALLASYPDRLVLVSPQRSTKVELPNPSGRRLPLYLNDGIKRTKAGQPRFEFSLGACVVAHRYKPNATAFDIEVKFSPAFMLAFAHSENTTGTLIEGIFRISNDEFDLQVEAATGRLVEYRSKVAGHAMSLTIRAEKLALQAEFRTIDGLLATATEGYNADSPWKSAAEFLVDELRYGASRSGLVEADESLGALRKLLSLWSPPDPADLFAEFDDGFFILNSEDSFWIPSQPVVYTSEELWKPGSTHRRELVAKFLLPVCRELFPKTGWWWPEARDAALCWGTGDPALVAGLKEAAFFPRIGPVGELLMAEIDSCFQIGLRNAAVRSKMPRHPAAPFRNDYRPLLQGDSWLGRWVLSLATALRRLDDSELRALVLLLPDFLPGEAVAQSLASLKSDSKIPVERMLPAILDRFWGEALGTGIKAAHAQFVTPSGEEPMRVDHGDHVSPADVVR